MEQVLLQLARLGSCRLRQPAPLPRLHGTAPLAAPPSLLWAQVQAPVLALCPPPLLQLQLQRRDQAGVRWASEGGVTCWMRTTTMTRSTVVWVEAVAVAVAREAQGLERVRVRLQRRRVRKPILSASAWALGAMGMQTLSAWAWDRATTTLWVWAWAAGRTIRWAWGSGLAKMTRWGWGWDLCWERRRRPLHRQLHLPLLHRHQQQQPRHWQDGACTRCL